MGKRKHSFADSDAKRTKNPFILDDVEEVDDDYDSEGESVADSVEATNKRTKKTSGGKRKSGTEKVSKELAAAIKETERRAMERQRQRNLFANMDEEQMQAWAKEHYNATGEGEEDAEEGDGLESDGDDSGEYDDENWMEDLIDRGFSLWMVRCGRRKERVNVRNIKRRVRQLKKEGTSLPIGHAFFHKAFTGLFWVEAKNRKDLLESLRDCKVPANEKNIKAVPVEEINATYSPRPRPVKETIDVVTFQVGMSVSITKGENLGREGMIVELGEDTVTVIFTPEIMPHTFRRNYVRVQD